MKEYKISIITPSYNQGQFIEQAINSVLNQRYAPFEHIIVDGGSTDNSVDIIKKYKHLKWVSERDEGQSDAINKGFLMATGDIIGWLNADDFYLDNVFESIEKNFRSENISGLYSDYFFVNKVGEITREMRSNRPIKWMSLFLCYIPSTTFFFRREIIDAGIKIDKELFITMDKEFFAHILYENYQLKYVRQFYAAFRWHDSNKSIDDEKVKKIRINEGLSIYNRYARIKIPSTAIYRFMMLISSIIRVIVKKTGR